MVAIRNRNTPVPHVFRYPKWEEGVFYPAGSLVSYPIQDPLLYDSDVVFHEFYVSKFDVAGDVNVPPPSDNMTWKFIMSTAQGLDSEAEERIRRLDSDISVAEEKIDTLIDKDSDLLTYIDSEINARIQNDSDIKALIDSEVRVRFEKDSEIWAYIDSEITQRIDEFNRDSDIYARRVFFTNDSDGMLQWNNDESTLDLRLNSDVTLQIGQEQVFYGKASEAISNGDAVMFAGAQGDHIMFAKADMNSVGFKDEYLIGVATQDFANNDFGFVTSHGKVRDLSTNDFAEGALLYLSEVTPGLLVDSEPGSPNHSIIVAAVTRSHNNHGTIFVRPELGSKIGGLHDVRAVDPSHGQILAWDSDTDTWTAMDINTAQALGGGSPYDYGSY